MKHKHELSIVKLNRWNIPFHEKVIIAGPCSVESEDQIIQTATKLKKINVDIIRAGIWKPRTHPSSFEGVGKKGLKWLRKVKIITRLPVMVEVAKPSHVEECLKNNIDILWIGARTTANPFQVQSIADSLRGTKIMVMIKNPINPDIELWIGALERINRSGIKNLAAIHRGFSSYNHPDYRYPPHWEIPIELKRRLPDIPLICDPSHICGRTGLLLKVAQKAMDLLFDGLMIESHIDPDSALSDGSQQIKPEALEKLLSNLKYRKTGTKDSEFQFRLKQLREKIDDIDQQIINLLANRMETSKEIGILKRGKNVSIYQPLRWEKLIKNRVSIGKKRKLSEAFILKIYEEIHQQSISVQENVLKKDVKKDE